MRGATAVAAEPAAGGIEATARNYHSPQCVASVIVVPRRLLRWRLLTSGRTDPGRVLILSGTSSPSFSLSLPSDPMLNSRWVGCRMVIGLTFDSRCGTL